MPYLIFWPLSCILMASAQGLLLPAIRRTPPGEEASQQAFALHWLLSAAYFLPYLLPVPLPYWQWVVAGLVVRVALFDVLLNHFAGDAILAVGHTAATDRLLRRLLPSHPELLSGILKAAALLLGALMLLFY